MGFGIFRGDGINMWKWSLRSFRNRLFIIDNKAMKVDLSACKLQNKKKNKLFMINED